MAKKINIGSEADILSRLLKWRHYLIFGFSFLVFFLSVFNNYNLDDELVTRSHPLTSQGIQAIPKIISSPYYSDAMGYRYEYRPVVLISFAIEHQFFGEQAFISHLINLLLYSVMSMLLLKLLDAFLGTDYSAFNLLTVLLFVAYPAHTEVVDSIKNRDEILALLFAFLAAIQAVRYYRSGNWYNFILSLLFLLTGTFAKQSVINFIFLIPLSLALFFQPVQIGRLLRITAALSLLIIGFANIHLLYQKALLGGGNIFFFTVIAAYKQIFAFLKRSISKLLAAISTINFALKQYAIKLFAGSLSIVKYSLFKLRQNFNKTQKYLKPEKATSDGFLDLPWQFRPFAIAGIMALLIGISVLLSLYLNSKIAVAIGIMVTIVALIFLVSPKKKVFVFWILTAAIIAASIISQSVFVYGMYLFLFYLACIEGQFGEKKEKWQIWAQIILLVISTLIFFYKTWDSSEFLVPVALFFAYKRSSSYPRLFIMTLVLILLFVLTGAVKEMFAVKLANAFAIVLLYAVFQWRSNIFVFRSIGRFFMCMVPVFVTALSLVAISHPENGTPPPTMALLSPSPSPHAPSQLPPPPVAPIPKRSAEFGRVVSDIAKTVLFTPATLPGQRANRPLTFIEAPLDSTAPVTVKVGNTALILGHYLKKVVIPYPLGFYYGYSMIEPKTVFGFLPIAILILHTIALMLAVYFWKRNAIWSFGIFVYLTGVAVYSNFFVAVPGIVADRFLLVPSIGYCIMMVALILKVFKVSSRTLNWGKMPIAPKALFIVLFISYILWSLVRTTQWKDKVTLMQHDIAFLNQSTQAHNLLAFALMESADAESNPKKQVVIKKEAIIHFQRALAIYPLYFNAAYDLGRAYTEIGMLDSAIIAYKYALNLDTSYSDIPLKLGDLLMETQRYNEAVPYLKKLISDQPSNYTGYDKLSRAYFLLKEYEKSIKVNRDAVKQVPNLPDPLVNIGRTFMAMNQSDSAHYYFVKANSSYPGYPIIEQLVNATTSLK